MAIKAKTQFVCNNCSFISPRWQGRCPSCGEWNTLAEMSVTSSRKSGGVLQAGAVQRLSELGPENTSRYQTGITELDIVLGGGIVPGSLIMLGGDPGIGKSTLALQLALNFESQNRTVLYVSGEESGQQIKMRSQRISAKSDLSILTETSLESILASIELEKPNLVVIDSIQTINSQEVNGVVGGVSQLSFATNSLMRLAKQHHVAIMIIGHVTKEGMLAGPKTLEHMVDTVLYLEGERFSALRILRTNKNRFGGINEVGVFEMSEKGLSEVANPAALFLEHRSHELPGACISAVLEGNKVLLLEIQALVNPSNYSNPKRASSGFDANRLQLILAILQRRLNINFSDQDVFINVAGGFKVDERAADLPVALAILSSFYNKTLPQDFLAFGEVGLLGEVRGVMQTDKRLREAEKLGFKQVALGGKQTPDNKKIAIKAIGEIVELKNLF